MTVSGTTTLSLAAVLAESAIRRPDHLAVVQGDRRLNYAQVWDLAARYGRALIDRGVAPGDRVALMAPNTVEFVAGYFGILAAGGTIVPIPAMLQPKEAAYLLQHSGARSVLADPTLLATATAAAGAVGLPAYELATLADGVDPLAHYVARHPDDVAVVFYTSGTSGAPKGARLTHLNLVMNATVAAFDCFDFTPNDVMFGCLPLFHVFGQSCAMTAAFRAGACLVLQPRFEPREALRIMAAEQATLMLGVPTMFLYLVQVAAAAREAGAVPADGPIVPSLRFAVSGGAALPGEVQDRFQEMFAAPIYEGYGLSETSPVASTNQPILGTRPGTIGKPIWGVDVAVADPGIADRIVLLPDGERGELVIRGHNVFAGYLDDDAATAGAVVDGWFRTGDIGIKDPDGFIRIVDRTKDVIIRGGYNVYPREVEELLMTHPDVHQVAVIGLPDPKLGEEVCAVVTPNEGVHIDPDELIAWSRERLAHHKCPRRVEIVEQLPMGPSQKVLKRELRTRYAPD